MKNLRGREIHGFKRTDRGEEERRSKKFGRREQS
jgi:hypothetical protein